MLDNMTPEQFAKMIASAISDANEKKGKVDTSAAKTVDELVKEITDMAGKMKKSNANLSVWNSLTGKANSEFASMRENIEELDKAIEEAAKTATASQVAELQKQRDEYRAAAVRKMNHESMVKFGKAVGDISTKALTGVGSLVKGLQGGESGIQVASGLMEAAVDVGTGATTALGNAAQTAGAALSTTTGKTKFLGYAMEGAGMALSFFAETSNKLAKFGIQVLSKEVEKTVKAFNDSSNAGAFFANGMTGLRDAALAAGLTVDQFAGVLKQHAGDLAATGMGVTEGSKRVGGALRAGGDSMKTQLLNLGYNFEQQAGLVAETMRDMRQSGGPLRASNAEVAAQTAKYAENLRVISAITGEDAKKKEEQVRQQASQLAFQQKLAGMTEQQRIGTLNAMKNMSDMERKNFMDMVNFGTVINKEGAAAAAMSPGLTNAVNGFYGAFRQGTLDEIEARRISRANTEQQKQDLLDNTAIGLAGAANVGGIAGQLADNMGKELEYRNRWSADAIDAAERGVAAQKNTADKLTGSVVGAEIAAQDLKIALQNELTPAIAQFAKVSKEMLGEVQRMLNDLGIGNGGGGGGTPKTNTIGSDVSKVGGLAMAGGVALEVLAGLSALTGVGAVASPFLASAGGAMLSGGAATTGVGTVLDMFKFSNGGISDVPAIFGEKGPEAAVPLPDGKTIPVTMDPQFGRALDLMNTAINDMNKNLTSLVESQKSQRGIQEQLVDHMRDTRDYTQKLLNVTM